MAKLLYSAITSLDAYVADEAGTFDWSVPDDEVHAYINDVIGPSARTCTGGACTRATARVRAPVSRRAFSRAVLVPLPRRDREHDLLGAA